MPPIRAGFDALHFETNALSENRDYLTADDVKEIGGAPFADGRGSVLKPISMSQPTVGMSLSLSRDHFIERHVCFRDTYIRFGSKYGRVVPCQTTRPTWCGCLFSSRRNLGAATDIDRVRDEMRYVSIGSLSLQAVFRWYLHGKSSRCYTI
jgi:hypothetical protein